MNLNDITTVFDTIGNKYDIIQNKNYYNITFIVGSNIIKFDTDFATFCISNDYDFNMDILNHNYNIQTIKTLLINNIYKKNNKIVISDSYNIYHNKISFTKCYVEYDKLNKNNNTIIIKQQQIPLKPHLIHKLIINEITQINTNQEYVHYMEPLNNSLFEWSIKLFINPKTNLGKQIKDHIGLSITLDSCGYPYIAPKIKYLYPNAKLDFILSLLDLDIMYQSNWSHVISLEKFILTLVSQLELLEGDYIVDNMVDNIYNNIINLGSLTKTIKYNKIPFKFDIKNMQSKNVSGIGYGSDNDTKWDVDLYISDRKQINKNHQEYLHKLYDSLKEEKASTTNINLIYNYIYTQIKALNLLEFQENSQIYICIFNIILIMIDSLEQYMINTIYEELTNFHEEVINILSITNTKNNIFDDFIIIFTNLSSKYIKPITEIIITDDIKVSYCNQMKKLQFGHYDLPETHLFYNKRVEKIEQKSVMRILSEISSLKQNLPLNWDTSIWIRVSKMHFNLMTILIAGPKDTPYENGLFEFHIYLPVNYPHSPPNVLLKTTGNETIRFNPNLYASGKVCLSLLGTWSGASGETWSPQSSSLLQVLISIQSLIFVNDPYFNEPGYEKHMKEPKYIDASRKYNEEKQVHTINLAMIDMVKNPVIGFEDVIKEHFNKKKEEIINRLNIWEQNSQTKTTEIKKYKEKFIVLMN
jgi:ubiquitin-protein ligase